MHVVRLLIQVVGSIYIYGRILYCEIIFHEFIVKARSNADLHVLLHVGVRVPSACVRVHLAAIWLFRVRRTVENKLFAGDERLEDVETELRAAKQTAQEMESRYEEVCSQPITFPGLI